MDVTASPSKDTDSDYEAYQTIVQLISDSIEQALIDILRKARDPHTFTHVVEGMADGQGVEHSITQMDLYNGFWSLARGLSADFNWSSTSGVPAHSKVFAGDIEGFGWCFRYVW
ncbi:hypothetical protein AB5J72_51530 (plasmid) [Streptomyces sp. CG1]|uniref:hypothetical protein n=1 Tax=Streptomyces sp. CG1 TaxID=1287523 RepID=UPI0034E2D991